MRTIIVPAMAAFALALAAAPASAEAIHVTVAYGDLDLSTVRGMKTLERRVAGAVNRLCGRSGLPIFTVEGERACVKEARASADREIAQLTDDRTTLALHTRR